MFDAKLILLTYLLKNSKEFIFLVFGILFHSLSELVWMDPHWVAQRLTTVEFHSTNKYSYIDTESLQISLPTRYEPSQQ